MVRRFFSCPGFWPGLWPHRTTGWGRVYSGCCHPPHGIPPSPPCVSRRGDCLPQRVFPAEAGIQGGWGWGRGPGRPRGSPLRLGGGCFRHPLLPVTPGLSPSPPRRRGSRPKSGTVRAGGCEIPACAGMTGWRPFDAAQGERTGASPLAPLAFHEGGDLCPLRAAQGGADERSDVRGGCPGAGGQGDHEGRPYGWGRYYPSPPRRRGSRPKSGTVRAGGCEIPACAGMTGWRPFDPAQGERTGASPLAPLAFHEGGIVPPCAARRGRGRAKRCSRGMPGGRGQGNHEGCPYGCRGPFVLREIEG